MTFTSQKKHQTTPQRNKDGRLKAILKIATALALIILCVYLIYTAVPEQTAPEVLATPAATAAAPAAADPAATSCPTPIPFPGTVGGTLDFSTIPDYSGQASLEVNGGIPFFTEEEIQEARKIGSYENYGELDSLGRCTSAMGNLSSETMPDYGERREKISDIHPTGWEQAWYDTVDSQTVMTRTHLIGWMLSAENANKLNLITGTRYMNSDIMTEYELDAARYIEGGKDRYVLYRVTPDFRGTDKMARGVLMEGYSLNDDGASVCFCEYLYNVQPGLEFDYSDGTSWYTGIFYDIQSDSVETDDIPLEQYRMLGGVITRASEDGSEEGVLFWGDPAMEDQWDELGYKTDFDQSLQPAA